MFSKILIKLVDQAIVPAILLLVTRVVSIVVLSRYYGVSLSIDETGFVFENPQAYMLVNSCSILSMILILSLGIFYILLKSFYTHDSHISPHLTAKLYSLRVSSFIQTSFDIYSQATVWMSYLYLMFFTAAALALFGIIFNWVFFATFALTVVSTLLFELIE